MEGRAAVAAGRTFPSNLRLRWAVCCYLYQNDFNYDPVLASKKDRARKVHGCQVGCSAGDARRGLHLLPPEPLHSSTLPLSVSLLQRLALPVP